jgi:hypothetical protein
MKKLHVLYDDAGKVGAICHVEDSRGMFLPGHGQHTAVLTIPTELEGHTPQELHRSVRVETKETPHRLVAKAK